MSKTVQVNEQTSFVLGDGRLVAIEEAQQIERNFAEQREFFPRHLAEDEKWKMVPEFVKENDFPMFVSVTDFALRQVQEWLNLRAAGEDDLVKKHALEDAAKVVFTSPLLDRLIRGKLAFDSNPPKSYNNPWYDLVEYGEDICIDIWFSRIEDDEVRIDGEKWLIIEKLENENYVVTYPGDEEEDLYLLSFMNEDDYERLLHPRLRKLSDGKERYSWKLTRLEIQ